MQEIIDAAFVALFAIALPVWGLRQARTLRRIMESQGGTARRAVYSQIMVIEWTLAALALVIWLGASRPLTELGLAAPLDWRFLASLAFALVATIVLALQTAAALKGDERVLRALRRRIASMRFFLPHDLRDLRRFLWLSLTAGVCEEILFRGYLIWWLGQFMPLWTAVVASALVFAAAHASYQDARGVSGVLLAGLIFGALFALTGSLIPAILLHIAVDITSGVSVWAAHRWEARGGRSPTAPVD